MQGQTTLGPNIGLKKGLDAYTETSNWGVRTAEAGQGMQAGCQRNSDMCSNGPDAGEKYSRGAERARFRWKEAMARKPGSRVCVLFVPPLL
jgi:hypothetical protein